MFASPFPPQQARSLTCKTYLYIIFSLTCSVMFLNAVKLINAAQSTIC